MHTLPGDGVTKIIFMCAWSTQDIIDSITSLGVGDPVSLKTTPKLMQIIIYIFHHESLEKWFHSALRVLAKRKECLTTDSG